MKRPLHLILAMLSLVSPLAARADTLEEIFVPADLSRIVESANCHELEETDYFACPKVRAYRWNALNTALPNVNSVNRAFANLGDYSVVQSTAAVAAAEITKRLRNQSSILDELFHRGEITRPVRQQGVDLTTNIRAYVESWQGLVFVDDSTYWAPSVNASVVILIDTTSGVVIEILHGDTDG